MSNPLNKADELTRRKFMSRFAKTMLGVGMLPWNSQHSLFAQSLPGTVINGSRPTARNVIYLYMNGGMSHLDTFDPKPGSGVEGPMQTIGTNVDGIRISEYMPSMAMHMDKAAVIRSMTSTQGAHEQGNYYMHTSYAQRGTIQHPGMGAWVMKMAERNNPTLPGSVRIGPGIASAGFLGPRFSPLAITDPSGGLKNTQSFQNIGEKELRERLALSELMDTEFHQRYSSQSIEAYDDVYEDALKVMRSEDLKAFDLSQEPKELREAYGSDRFAKGCLLARRLIEHNVRFVEVTLGGWDTHNDNFTNVADRAGILDQALSTLLMDLERRGLLEETLVVLATEFGRTPKINVNDGRDHYPKAFSCLLAGGGVQGGQVYGATDKTGANITENKVEVPDFNATIAYALGMPLKEVVTSPSGRPFTIAHDGEPLTALF